MMLRDAHRGMLITLSYKTNMKIFEFDGVGNMKVTVSSAGKDINNKDVAMTSQHDIQPSQLAAHLPMFAADMSAAELAEANAIIAAQ